MPKTRDVLTEAERLEIARLRLRMLSSGSIIVGRKYKKEILEIIKNAKKRYLNDSKKNII